MKTNDTAKICELISPGTKVVIVSHANPDGDAIGSSLALCHAFTDIGIHARVMVPNDFPSFLAWMPGTERILVYKHRGAECLRLAAEADLIFCLDFNGVKRMEKLAAILDVSRAVRILIDHHPQPETDSFQLMISDTQTSSTSELVYRFLCELAGNEIIDKKIAECLFTGIATDTGSFSYSCNDPETFRVVADLIGRRINVEKIHRLIYDTYSENRMRLLGFCLSDRMKVLPEYGTAYIYLSRDDLKRFGFQVGDTEGVVNYALSINGICMAVLFTEKENHIRLSLRSKGNFSVNDFVRNHFEGGGHRNAAGGNSYLSLADTLQKFESVLPDYRNDLSHCCYDD